MDSDSSESYYTKREENDSDSETHSASKRNARTIWDSERTLKLINTYRNDCRELWDINNPLYKDKMTRTVKNEYLAQVCDTTVDEITRKIHNLRSQFNSVLRKIKRRRAEMGCGEEGSVGGTGSGWEYFQALTFLTPPAPSGDPLEDGVNIALAEFQANEEVEFGAALRAKVPKSSGISGPSSLGGVAGRVGKSPSPRVAASAPPPLPAHAHPMLWPEEPQPRIRASVNADECQIFGDFVASELRTLRSDESRKKLKRLIQKAILQIGEQEDRNIISKDDSVLRE